MRCIGLRAGLVLMCVAAATALVGCGSSSSSSGGGSGPVTIGVSLPLSGVLGGGGVAIQAGYKIAENEVNAAGGLEIDGKRHMVKMLFADNRSDPTTAADQTRDFVLKNGAVALLGSTTPALVNPEGDIAEREKIPLVTSLVGGTGFLTGNKAGWHYYWNIFPIESGLAQTAIDMAGLTKTNKKVGVLVTEDPDGQAQGPEYISVAKKDGYNVVYSGTVPTGTQDFSTPINAMKAKGVQVLLTLFDAPDGAALWKQMHAVGFKPKVAICQECASLPNWLQVAGPAGEGAGNLAFWSPGAPDSNLGGHLAQFDLPTNGEGTAASYSAAKVLFSAIERAGSTSPAKINAALATTNLVTPLGPLKFAPDHLDAIPGVGSQWQGKDQVTVYPTTDKGVKKLVSPPPGL